MNVEMKRKEKKKKKVYYYYSSSSLSLSSSLSPSLCMRNCVCAFEGTILLSSSKRPRRFLDISIWVLVLVFVRVLARSLVGWLVGY